LEIFLKNQPAEKQRLLHALHAFSADHKLGPKVVQAAELVLEEHLTNIFKYAYSDTALHEIVVRFACDESSFEIEVQDDGRSFNPLDRPVVNTSAPLEQRPVGGLGIHLIREFMDQLDYRREGGKNILRMIKRIAA